MLKSSKRASRAAVVQRHFTKEGVDPLDGVKWVSASSALTNPSGEVLALREGLEAPKDWSQLAVDIAAMKYFRRAGLHGDAKKGETSVRQLIHRLANTIRGAGEQWGYFRDGAEASAFEAELSYMLVNQIGAFNSPVWFNCGLFQQYGIAGEGGNWAWDPTLGHPVETGNAYERPQCSACFIQGVDDSLMSIFELVKNEARLFKYGSGTGSNFSALRGRQEKLSGGGTSSGLMSFLEVLDRAAGATKSGGTTRRAAKMVCLNVDHPEILDFVRWKSREEKKAQALIAAGYPADFNGEAYHTVSGQNSNNSVRVTDEFMRAVEQDGAWETRARTTGAVCETFPARELWEEIGKAAWSCADPGVQYDSTINDWHTCPNSGRINASNPCCFVGETLVDTSEGRIPIEALEMLSVAGLPLPLSFSFDAGDRLPVLRQIKKVWRSGEAATLVEVKTDKGVVVRCTPEHRFLTYAGEYVEARDLKAGQRLRKIGRGELAGRVTMQHRGTERYPDGCSYMSRWMWEQVNGPIPEGHHIHHVNGDPRDNRISNLECVEGTRHHSDHAKGLDNPRAYGLPFEKLAEVWEAVSAADHGRKSKIGKVTVCRWNKYVKDNGLAGAVPYSNGSLQGVPLDQFAKMVEDYRQDVNDRVESVTPITLPSPVPVYDMEVEGVHNFSVASPGISHSVVVHNSEYMFLDDTACNLSSLNLTKFLVEGADGSLRFDIEGYRHAARVFFLAQEILVDFSSYPTKTIAQNSHDYRPLGLGYANLGTLLMVLGIAYDSPEGRAVAAGLTAILTGHAYLVSAEVASIKGAFAGYAANREPMLRVMRKHRDAAFALDQALIDGRPSTLGGELAAAASDDWDSAVVHGERHGYRNAQATVLAPTGTIGLLMDCDTTGIEPDFALVKFKKLAGGGYFKIVNASVERALGRLGYSKAQITEILAYVVGTNTFLGAPMVNREYLKGKGFTNEDITRLEGQLPGAFTVEGVFSAFGLGADLCKRLGLEEAAKAPGWNLLAHWGLTRAQIDLLGDTLLGRMTVEGAPHLRDEHLPVFDCANRCGKHGTRYLKPMSHVQMMAAVQPFLSGAISKTVNLPNEATVDEVMDIYTQGWKLGLKAVALYRDGCKASQPLSTSGKDDKTEKEDKAKGEAEVRAAAAVDAPPAPPAAPVAVSARPTVRYRLPARRRGFTQEAKIGGHKVFLRTGEYGDGQLGEIFIDMHKEGAAFRSLMNSFAIAVSMGLQHGVPLQAYVDMFTFTRFEPRGSVVGHANVKYATSIIDYVFRALGVEYLKRYDLAHVLPEGDGDAPDPAPYAAPAAPEVSASNQHLGKMMGDAPMCDVCGHITVRNGTCYRCHNCGNSMGCS